MKIKRFESYDYNDYIYISNDEEMISWISDIISCEVDLQPVKYHPDDYEINPGSVTNAAVEVLKELKKLGVDFDIIYAAKKYNL